MTGVRRLAALLLVAALAATGCTAGSDSARHSGPPDPEEPAPRATPFHAATTKVPEGYTVAQCSDLRRPAKNSGLAVRFVVPPGYHPAGNDGAACSFAAGFGTEFSVGFAPPSTLRSEKERNVDPFEGDQGDDSVGDVSYAGDVPVFGDHTGERLDFYCYCDGQDLDERSVQARGVRLGWTTRHGRQARHEAAYDAVTASMALVHSDMSTCSSRGRTVTFRPPIPQTESIDFSSGRCHVYLRPGRNSLQRYAEIELRPRLTLAERADRLRTRNHVVAVHYQPGRLTWVFVRQQPGPYGEPAGRWRAVTVATGDAWVTWSARPRQWRTESDDARRFVDSVRP